CGNVCRAEAGPGRARNDHLESRHQARRVGGVRYLSAERQDENWPAKAVRKGSGSAQCPLFRARAGRFQFADNHQRSTRILPKRCVEEVIVIARRGPLEAKFDEKEFANIQIHLDREAFQDELRRVEPAMKAVGQDVAKVAEETFPVLKLPDQQTIPPRLIFRFLSSPSAITGGPDGRIARLTVT